MELLVVFSLLYFSFSFYIVIDTDCLVGFCGLHCRRRLFQAQMHTKEFRGYISCGGSISSIPIPNLSDGVMEGNLQYSSVTGYAYNFRSIDYLYNLLTQLLTEFINREKGGKSRYTRRMKRELTTSPLRESGVPNYSSELESRITTQCYGEKRYKETSIGMWKKDEKGNTSDMSWKWGGIFLCMWKDSK